MAVIIGLDFGNKYSYPSFVRGMDEKTRLGGECFDLLPVRQVMAAGVGIPSVFFYSARRGELVGVDAVRARPAANRRDMLKRNLGGTFTIDGTTFSYDSAIQKVVESCVRAAQKELWVNYREKSSQISLAYPVSFNSTQLRHLIELVEAIEIDGQKLNVVGTIAEPAAAALEYLAEHGGKEKAATVLAYDLGGGTFDLSVVTVYPAGRQRPNGTVYYYDVLCQNGDPRLGGVEFDEKLREIVLAKLNAMGVHPSGGQADTLLNEVESAKIRLSDLLSTTLEFPNQDGDYDEIEITRAEFEAAARPLVQRTVDMTRQMLTEHPEVEMILLTGGASQMPMIRQTLLREFPRYGEKNIDLYQPSRAISYGAARYGANETPVQQRTVWDLGIQYFDSQHKLYVETLIPAGTPVPYSFENTAYTSTRTDTCQSVVFEARTRNPDRYEISRDYRLVTVAQLHFKEEVEKGTPVVDILGIDARNVLTVKTYDPKDPAGTNAVSSVEYRSLR